MNSEDLAKISGESEVLELLKFMSASGEIEDLGTRSIPVHSGELRLGTWLPAGLLNSDVMGKPGCLNLLFISERQVPRYEGNIQVLDRGTFAVNMSGLGNEPWQELSELALDTLLEWMTLHLDAVTIEVVTDDFTNRSIEKHSYHAEDVPDTGEEILTAGPLIGPREASYVLDAVLHGWNKHHSDYLARFEKRFASYVETKHALATSSCTGALHLALLAMGIGPGDEVIVPETTWVATGAAVRYVGATPVFADVDEASWLITADSIVQCITDKTRAILPVHLYGFPADMVEIMKVASDRELFVLEDAAPAIGALVAGRPVGSFGHMAAFSFQGAKMLVTGEGGMLVTSLEALHELAWKQQDHGRVPGTFSIDVLGRKYKMSNQTAALGLAQLESVELQIRKKRRVNQWYREFLKDIPGLSFQEELAGTRSICWMTSIKVDFDGKSRDDLMKHLKRLGIDSRPAFPPLSAFPIWSVSRPIQGRNAAVIGEKGVNLPSGVQLSRASVQRVSEAISEWATRDS